jgi:hypothetical protein
MITSMRRNCAVAGVASVLVAMLSLSPAYARTPACKSQAAAFAKSKSARHAFALAECNEEAGKLKTAADQYNRYLRGVKRLPAAKRGKERTRRDAAKQRLKALRKRMPLLSFKLPGDLSDYTVKIDAVEQSERTLRFAQPFNPGSYEVEVELPNGTVERHHVELAEGDSREITVQATSLLDPVSKPPPAKAAPEPWEDDRDVPEGEDSTPSEPIPMRTWAYVAGGVGAAGILVGTITGGLAIGEKSTIDDNCNGEACNHQGKLAADDAQALALGSTISVIVGFAGLGAGVAIWFLAPDDDTADDDAVDDVDVALVLQGAGLGLRGSW